MTIAVIGNGKTGKAVIKLLGQDCGLVYNSQNLPTAASLRQHQGVIIFVPAKGALQVLDQVLAAQIPAAWGSTAVNWPPNLTSMVQAPWVIAENFSLSMLALEQAIKAIGNWSGQLPSVQTQITETHHTDKQDAPSGTAKRWLDWYGQPADIESLRVGDSKGQHQLTVDTPFEQICVQHLAKSRDLFAHGAIWAMQRLLQRQLDNRIYSLSELWCQPN